jgi:uncharacterized protein
MSQRDILREAVAAIEMRSDRPRAVFDCNVLLQAVLANGPAFRCLLLVESNPVELVISPATLAEIRDVLTRPKLVRKYPQLEATRVRIFLDGLTRKASLIESVPHRIDLPRDPKDEPYLDLAAAANADYLVTRDKDLLVLQREPSAEADLLRTLCPNLRILEPQEFLAEINAASA